MKHAAIIAGLCALLAIPSPASENEALKAAEAKHRAGVEKIADEQDELAADVQQLVVEQTLPEVIKLLREVEAIMGEATDRLADADTGGETIAAQTEIVEKIHAAAKEKQSQGGGGQAGGAMMDMMERMMGKEPGGKKKGEGQNGKPGDEGGKGQTGLSDSGNEAATGEGGGAGEVRRVPKAAGAASLELPEEFRKAFDAYNRGAEKKVK